MVGRVHGPGGEIEKERLGRRDLLGVGDHALRLFDQIGGEVITLLRGLFRLGLGIITHKLGIVLVGVAA